MFRMTGDKNANQTLSAIAEGIGMAHDYKTVKADFVPFKDFKVKWMRSISWIDFDVSDYLLGAPEEVLEGVIRTIFRKIEGAPDSSYPECVCQYLTSKDFVKRNQATYIRRTRGYTTTSMHHDLNESYDRLIAAGLVEMDEDMAIGWIPSSRSDKTVGHASTLMKAIMLRDSLDSEDIPKYVLDYALYTQLVHVGLGFNATGKDRSVEYTLKCSEYPDAEDAELFLESHGYRVI